MTEITGFPFSGDERSEAEGIKELHKALLCLLLTVNDGYQHIRWLVSVLRQSEAHNRQESDFEHFATLIYF